MTVQFYSIKFLNRPIRPINVLFGSKDRPLSSWIVKYDQMAVRFGLRPSTFRCNVPFCMTIHFKDRPLSPLWTIHFEPDTIDLIIRFLLIYFSPWELTVQFYRWPSTSSFLLGTTEEVIKSELQAISEKEPEDTF